MRRFSANLARHRFVNVRPVVRASILLWVVALVLTAYNGREYWRSFAGHEDKTRRLAEVVAEMRREDTAIQEGLVQLRGMRLDEQNEEVAFLNDRITERTFAWSVLFDRLATVLPRRVRLLSLNPRRPVQQRGRHRTALAEQRVYLQLRGVAEGDEALLDLVDALFADAAFEDPQLKSESREDDGLLYFQMDIAFLPEVAASQLRGESLASSDLGAPAQTADRQGAGSGDFASSRTEQARAEQPDGVSSEGSQRALRGSGQGEGSQSSRASAEAGDPTPTPGPVMGNRRQATLPPIPPAVSNPSSSQRGRRSASSLGGATRAGAASAGARTAGGGSASRSGNAGSAGIGGPSRRPLPLAPTASGARVPR